MEYKNYNVITPPMRAMKWVGMFIRSKYEMNNGYANFPKGTIFKITSSGITKHLETLPCPCCNVKLKMTSKDKIDWFITKFDFLQEL